MAEIYDVGDRPRLTITFTDFARQPSDPFAVNCHVRSPSGATVVYTYPSDISKSSTGVYTLDLPLLEAGDYKYKWNSTDSFGVPEASDQGYISARHSLA